MVLALAGSVVASGPGRHGRGGRNSPHRHCPGARRPPPARVRSARSVPVSSDPGRRLLFSAFASLDGLRHGRRPWLDVCRTRRGCRPVRWAAFQAQWARQHEPAYPCKLLRRRSFGSLEITNFGRSALELRPEALAVSSQNWRRLQAESAPSCRGRAGTPVRLAPGETCSIDALLELRPADPDRYRNLTVTVPNLNREARRFDVLVRLVMQERDSL